MLVALCRRQQKRQPPMVLDAVLRQPCEGAPALPPPRGLKPHDPPTLPRQRAQRISQAGAISQFPRSDRQPMTHADLPPGPEVTADILTPFSVCEGNSRSPVAPPPPLPLPFCTGRSPTTCPKDSASLRNCSSRASIGSNDLARSSIRWRKALAGASVSARCSS